MYSYKEAIALPVTVGSQWVVVDLSVTPMREIFSQYSRIYLTLTNPALEDDVYVDLDVLKSTYGGYSLTLTECLLAIGNTTLPYVDTLPTTEIKYARYSDAVQVGYKISTCKMGYHLAPNAPVDELKDLVMSRPSYSTDMAIIHSHCLVSVNGYYHATDTDGIFAYAKDGGTTMRKSNLNHLGILSFLDIGSLQKVKLDKANIYPFNEDAAMKDKIYFNIEEDLTGKSVFLVLGGYLVFMQPEVFWQRGEKSFALNLNMLPYVERLYESDLYIDLSELELETDAINFEMRSVDELWSDRVISNYMTMSQSFLVIVDTPNLATRQISIRSCNVPGKFTAYEDPRCPLIVNYGKVAEYWKIHENGHWAVNVRDSYKRNYLFTSHPSFKLENVTNQVNPMVPFKYSRGFLLEISGFN